MTKPVTTTSTVAAALPAQLRAALVRRAHGVHGTLRVEPLGGDASRFSPGLVLRVEGVEGSRGTLSVAGSTPLPDGDLLLTVTELTDRNAADALRGAYLCVDAGAARALAQDEWFEWQLVGLSAVDATDATPLGTVIAVEECPEHHLLVVRGVEGGERRIPLVRAHVAGVDVEVGVVRVIPWPEDAD